MHEFWGREKGETKKCKKNVKNVIAKIYLSKYKN